MILSNLPTYIPTLSFRKDIWTHFPVCLVKISSSNGYDRWAVQWHQKNLSDWSQDIPGYETIAKLRLFKALMACPKWKIEKPIAPSDLCILAMTQEDIPDLFAELKTIQKLDDVKTYFPVCWKRIENVYSFEFHNMHLRNLARSTNMDESFLKEKTIEMLLPILSQFGTLEDTDTGICKLTAK